jgi:23S rRNA (guanosine2251-2'-O)-methyltransferase
VAEGADADGRVAEIVAVAERRGVPVRSVARGRIDAVAGTEAPQGVVAWAEPVRSAGVDDLARRPGPGGGPPLVVVLDGVTDPHNVGAIMRSALAAGASGLVIGRHRAARLTPAAVKAAAGAVEHLPVAVAVGIPAALREVAAAGVWTVGLDAAAATRLWDLRVATEAVALVLGAEGRGLSRLTRDVCELTVSIPLAGPLDSLNVSAAAALACFEVARARAPLR